MDLLTTTILIVYGILVLVELILSLRLNYYKKLVDIQDEICLKLLKEAGENNRMMKAMGLLSEEDFEKQITKLIGYTDELIKGGNWASFLHRKGEKNEH